MKTLGGDLVVVNRRRKTTKCLNKALYKDVKVYIYRGLVEDGGWRMEETEEMDKLARSRKNITQADVFLCLGLLSVLARIVEHLCV